MWLKVTWWRIRQWLRHNRIVLTSLDVIEAQQREEVAFLCVIGDAEQLWRAVRIFETWRDQAKPGREQLHALWLLGMLHDELRRRGVDHVPAGEEGG